MNKNSKQRVAAARSAFARVKHGRARKEDVAAAQHVGHKPALDQFPKVARGKGAH